MMLSRCFDPKRLPTEEKTSMPEVSPTGSACEIVSFAEAEGTAGGSIAILARHPGMAEHEIDSVNGRAREPTSLKVHHENPAPRQFTEAFQKCRSVLRTEVMECQGTVNEVVPPFLAESQRVSIRERDLRESRTHLPCYVKNRSAGIDCLHADSSTALSTPFHYGARKIAAPGSEVENVQTFKTAEGTVEEFSHKPMASKVPVEKLQVSQRQPKFRRDRLRPIHKLRFKLVVKAFHAFTSRKTVRLAAKKPIRRQESQEPAPARRPYVLFMNPRRFLPRSPCPHAGPFQGLPLHARDSSCSPEHRDLPSQLSWHDR